MKILVIDIGGTHVKALATGQEEERKLPSGPDLTAEQMTEQVLAATADWKYDAVSIGLPAPIVQDRPIQEPVNLGQGWVDFDFEGRFGRPVRVINDAAMQALGSYEGGKMLFLGLGTGLGTTLIVDKVIVPLELGHLPYRRGRSFEDYVGRDGLERLGKKRWREAVEDVTARLKAAFVADYVVLGGGNVKKLKDLPPDARRGDNRNAFLGGFRLWQDYPLTESQKAAGLSHQDSPDAPKAAKPH